MENFENTYKNKKVLITGHTGFKGAWLSLWLREIGANIIGYSLEPPTDPNLFDSINLKDKITHITGDVRDEVHLNSIFKKHQPDFVFHMAAQPIVRLSYKEPKHTYDVNVMGTVNVLEAVRKTNSIRVCVVITSDKCYENKEWIHGYREIDSMGGHDPYSSSKGCAELVTSSYGKSFFHPKDHGIKHNVVLASARAGNVIGGGDWGEDRIIPDCVKSLSKKKKIIIRNPMAVRPWQYVLEPLGGYLLLGALMYKEGVKHRGPWNFGPESENIITVEELVKHMIKYWGEGNYGIDGLEHPHEAGILKLDASKAKALLGWKSQYDPHESIKKTVDWYGAFYNGARGKKLYELTLKEILDFKNFKIKKK